MEPIIAAEIVKFLVYLREDVLKNHTEVQTALDRYIRIVSHEMNGKAVNAEFVSARPVVENRRQDERDPGESEQHEAEKLGLASKRIFGKKKV